MRNSEKTALKTVKVKRERLKTTLAENKEKHQREFEEAMTGYHARRESLASDLVNAAAAFAENPKDRDLETNLQQAYHALSGQTRPSNYSKEYQRAIQLADWEVADEIELSINDFNCYVLDEWDWTRGFKHLYEVNSVPL